MNAETMKPEAERNSPPPAVEPQEALRQLVASMEHFGTPESWPDGFYEQAQLALLHEDEEAAAKAEEEDESYNKAARECAREMYGSDDVDFDTTPEVSVGDDGAYVSAWVFVPHASLPMRTVEDADDEASPPPEGGYDAS
ncbi:hypothetical protein [Myxococcus sp. CA039A]|uniref:hypothetical protein n=1 Tax=Myxococcus sp. CA039A TaxID=2741737 RepID=UPI00157B0CEC|nr:hypothetical protein [Myxococcus sp. CA039A]NTX57956.1 hypothetical protein [Myxococcus sp. CA039A]